MDTRTTFVETLIERVEVYGKTTLELSKLKVLQTISTIATSLISNVSFMVMFLFCLLILNIGFALFLGEQLGKSYYGFFVVAAFDFVIALVFRSYMKSWIKKSISEFMISQVL